MKANKRPLFVSSLMIVWFLSIFGCQDILDKDVAVSNDYEVTTLAGHGQAGFSDGLGNDAKFHNPGAIILDQDGNLLVADVNNHRIRKVTPDGLVSTLVGTGQAGNENGDLSTATLSFPQGIALDLEQNLFITQKTLIRKLSVAGSVTTVAGLVDSVGFVNGNIDSATFHDIKSVVVDQFNHVYVTDYYNHVIRKISVDGEVSTFAGTGAAGIVNGLPQDARFNHPMGMAMDLQGTIYLADESNDMVRKINNGGVVEIAAGSIYGYADGAAANAKFKSPAGISIDNNGDIYVADVKNYRIRLIKSSGIVETIAGNGVSGYRDDLGTEAILGKISGIAIDAEGTIYVSDQSNHCIRKIAKPSTQP